MEETQLIRYHGNSGPISVLGLGLSSTLTVRLWARPFTSLGHLRMMGLDWTLLALTVYEYYTVQFSCVECD